MYKYFFVFVCAIFCCAQCMPFDASHSASSTTSQLHLMVNNSTQSTNYHLTPVMEELENIDQQIDATLKAILPYLNFFFDSLLGEPKPSDEDDCINEMVFELVPDETAMPPTPQPDEKADKKPQPEDEPTPDTTNTEGKSGDKPTEPEPVISSAPEKPVDNVQKNP